MFADDFKNWWYEFGSGLKPLPGHDHEQHAARIAELAWVDGRASLAVELINSNKDRKKEDDNQK